MLCIFFLGGLLRFANCVGVSGVYFFWGVAIGGSYLLYSCLYSLAVHVLMVITTLVILDGFLVGVYDPWCRLPAWVCVRVLGCLFFLVVCDAQIVVKGVPGYDGACCVIKRLNLVFRHFLVVMGVPLGGTRLFNYSRFLWWLMSFVMSFWGMVTVTAFPMTR